MSTIINDNTFPNPIIFQRSRGCARDKDEIIVDVDKNLTSREIELASRSPKLSAILQDFHRSFINIGYFISRLT